MNTRSIRFRLVVPYAGLVAAVLVAFGAYTYGRLDVFLHDVLQSSLEHRAQQIAQGILSKLPAKGERYVAAEIEARYAPALNEKFVRVTNAQGKVIYLSEAPNDRTFTPEEIPPFAGERSPPATQEWALKGYAPILISRLPATVGGSDYLVEVGTSLSGSRRILQALLLALALGVPIVLGVAVLGGSMLVKRALAPVQKIMGAAQDITLRHLDRRLPTLDSGDELAGLSVVLNQMIERLDESFQTTSRFTADASHELRTPLTIIHGELEAILLGQTMTGELRDELASLLDEVKRLVRIVEGLVALSRLDTGEAQTERVRVDLGVLATTTAEQMCLLAEEKKIELVCRTGPVVAVEGDRSRLKQVVVNLLDNAIKYTPDRGQVSLAVRAENGSACLEVSDTGPGVAETALPHLFERFYRAEEARSGPVTGAGLGLSIVHSICSAHGGTVTADNQPGGGCRVTVRLPRAIDS